MFDWKDCFPKGYEPRKEQIEGIEFALKAYESGKKFVILELPVGTGKSFIATTLGEYFNKLNESHKTYILTTQLILQAQYKKEFDYHANISSKVNYMCDVFPDTNCGQMKLIHKFTTIPKCEGGDCPYVAACNEFQNKPIGITNTAFFFSNVQHNEDFIKNRELIVIDEAHNLEEEIIRFRSVELDNKVLIKDYGYPKEDWIKKDEDVLDWLFESFYDWVAKKKESLESFIKGEVTGLNLNRAKTLDLAKKYDFFEKTLQQLEKARVSIINDKGVWIPEHNDNIVSLKPLFAKDFSEDSIFKRGKKILLMSGTILNKDAYCRQLGIDKNDCEFLSLDSPFPVENRRIFLMNSGSMSRKNIEKSYPNVVSDIKKILELHKNDKGIIHVSSHAIAKRLYEDINDDRLVVSINFKSRDQMLEFHSADNDNTVLLSPSMMEGLDLKGDLSRFQIIAKIPYPNLGSKYISTKKDMIRDWYAYQTAKVMVQAYGRSIRSKDDYAMTYITDSDFRSFYKWNAHLLPKYFKEAICHGKL